MAGAWRPDEQRVSWPDAGQLASQPGIDLYLQIVRYHRQYTRHQRFNAAILRNLNETEATGMIIAPDGQEFSVSPEIWPSSGFAGLRRGLYGFKCNDAGASWESIGLIRPPVLGPTARGLDSGRLRSVFLAIRAEDPLPPVCIIREAYNPIATLLDEAHRYFASVAAGFSTIPAVHVSLDDAIIGYRYEPASARSK